MIFSNTIVIAMILESVALTELLKGILIAYYLYETPIREIARESGIPINTIKSHLHRGRKLLRGRLEVQP